MPHGHHRGKGRLRAGQQLYVGDARKPFKLAHLHDAQGGALSEKRSALPGEICAISKVDELHYDAVVHDSHDEDHYHLREPSGPPPLTSGRSPTQVRSSGSSSEPCATVSPGRSSRRGSDRSRVSTSSGSASWGTSSG